MHAQPLFGSGRTLVSLPARELIGVDVPASVLSMEEVMALPVSGCLKAAIQLLEPHLQAPRFVVRSEVFTHGATRRWLDSRADGASDHLALSDGTTIKLLSGLDNHVFTYGSGCPTGWRSLKHLTQWAPEIFGTLRSQINSFLGAKSGGQRLQPRTELLFAQADSGGSEGHYADYYELVLNQHPYIQAARRIVEYASAPSPNFADYERLYYVPLTGAALSSRRFTTALARVLRHVYLDTSRLVVMRIPDVIGGGADAGLPERIEPVLAALAHSGVLLPKYSAHNILMTSIDPRLAAWGEAWQRTTILAHESLDYWRMPREAYQQAGALRIHFDTLREDRQAKLAADMSQVFEQTFSIGKRDLKRATQDKAAAA